MNVIRDPLTVPVPVALAPARPDALERAAGMFRAAGDIGRLRLLELLLREERCVGDLANATGANYSTVSQQLKLLREEKPDCQSARRQKHLLCSR